MDDHHHASFKEIGSYLEMLGPYESLLLIKKVPRTLVIVCIDISEFFLRCILGTIYRVKFDSNAWNYHTYLLP
jgi:hypothetical protein